MWAYEIGLKVKYLCINCMMLFESNDISDTKDGLYTYNLSKLGETNDTKKQHKVILANAQVTAEIMTALAQMMDFLTRVSKTKLLDNTTMHFLTSLAVIIGQAGMKCANDLEEMGIEVEFEDGDSNGRQTDDKSN